jgi:copper chaperone
MATRTYLVTGMTCGQCVSSVTEEVAKVVGVEAVAVDLASGQVTVTGDRFTDEQVTAAVAEAGYAIATT